MEREGYRPLGRRAFLALVGLGAGGVVVGASVQDALERATRRITEADPTGAASFLPTSARFRLYSVAGFNPDIDTDEYRLLVGGLVDRELDLAYADLLTRPGTSITRDFQCVTGWRVPDVEWAGVTVGTLIDEAGPRPEATHVRFFSFDGVYTTTLTMEQARRDDVIVATDMLGARPVRREHGGPVRLYVAPMYGYKSLKWLAGFELTDEPDPEGYWEERGYDADAWVGGSNGRADDPT